MGQILSEPVTTKESSYCQNSELVVGSSCMQGWRISMEDAHTHILALPEDPTASFFGVYDGHGGAKIAEYAGKNLHKFVVKQPKYTEGKYEKALKQAFLDIDSAMLNDKSLKNEFSGSTAIVCLLKSNQLFVANVGDSRAVGCINGKVDVLSIDHKPSNETELKRITAAGGWVEANRVNGNLALSRALGDFLLKRNEEKSPEEQVITAFPDVQTRTITPDWEFIVMACDGIWDVMTNEEVVDFVRNRIGGAMCLEDICEDLMSRCLAPDIEMGGLGCDNMTVIIIAFLHGKTYDALCAKCASPNSIGNGRNVVALPSQYVIAKF